MEKASNVEEEDSVFLQTSAQEDRDPLERSDQTSSDSGDPRQER